MLKGERDEVLCFLECGDSWAMVDPFGDDDLDSSQVLSRIGPSLRQHLCMKRRKSELIIIAVLVRVWPVRQRRLSSMTCKHAYERTYL